MASRPTQASTASTSILKREALVISIKNNKDQLRQTTTFNVQPKTITKIEPSTFEGSLFHSKNISYYL